MLVKTNRYIKIHGETIKIRHTYVASYPSKTLGICCDVCEIVFVKYVKL